MIVLVFLRNSGNVQNSISRLSPYFVDKQTEVQGQPHVSEMVDHFYPSSLLESNYFMEFPEFLEKHSNFETLTQQHVRNTKYSTIMFKDGSNLYLNHTRFFKKVF